MYVATEPVAVEYAGLRWPAVRWSATIMEILPRSVVEKRTRATSDETLAMAACGAVASAAAVPTDALRASHDMA